jgi:hypothetical protein
LLNKLNPVQDVKINPFEKNSNSIEYQFKKEKNSENEPKSEIYAKLFDEDSYEKEKSNSAEKFSNANNLSENLSYELGNCTNKTVHPKIFKTTVIQRKKSVNFKVIKNKERDSINSNTQNEVNHYEKINNNKNNFNNYLIEEQSNSNRERIRSFIAFDDSIREENTNYKLAPNNKSQITDEYKLNPFNDVNLLNKINFGNNNQSCFSSSLNEINITKTEIHSTQFNKANVTSNGYQKKCKKETYIDILIKAADRITQLGYYSTENQIPSLASIASINSVVSINDETKFKPASVHTEKDYSHESFIIDSQNKIEIEQIEEVISQKVDQSPDTNSHASNSNSNLMDCDESSNCENNNSGTLLRNKTNLKSYSSSIKY